MTEAERRLILRSQSAIMQTLVDAVLADKPSLYREAVRVIQGEIKALLDKPSEVHSEWPQEPTPTMMLAARGELKFASGFDGEILPADLEKIYAAFRRSVEGK